MRTTVRILTALALGSTLGLAACGSDTTPPPPSSATSATEHGDADVAFATRMIQHHAQALAMVDLTRGRQLDPEVQALADDIAAAQAPEIETMTGWLRAWGEDVPETVRDHGHAGHDMGDMGGDAGDVPGMMSAEDMATLDEASDADFSDLWLRMMQEHHEGAIAMAKDEQADGRYAPATKLAARIVVTQSAEVDTIERLLS